MVSSEEIFKIYLKVLQRLENKLFKNGELFILKAKRFERDENYKQ